MGNALDAMIADMRENRFGIAAGLVEENATTIALSPGADPLEAATRFEIGSITKTFTATLLATKVVDGSVGLDDAVGGYIEAGACGGITLRQLASHTSGLPRLAPDLLSGQADPDNPYAHYGPDRLLGALRALPPPVPGKQLYSNLGFTVLGHVLSVVAGQPLEECLAREVLGPLGLMGVRCHGTERLVPGYRGNRAVPHWDDLLVGAGGLRASIADLTRWVEVNLYPDRTPLSAALRLAQRVHDATQDRMGLAWLHQGPVLRHNGGTAGFHSFCGFNPSAGVGVAVLTNRFGGEATDDCALRLLTAWRRRHSPGDPT